MAGKKFKFRTDGNRRTGIKEVVSRGMSIRGPRISISVGLDSDFNLSKIHTIEGNILTPIRSTKGLKRGKGGKAIYYPIDELSYIATVTLQYNKNMKVVEKLLTVYIPKVVCTHDEIYCLRITSRLTQEETEQILNNICGYATSRA